MQDYSERRRRELHEDAVAGALAAHAPQDIASLRDNHPEEDSEYEPAGGRTHGYE